MFYGTWFINNFSSAAPADCRTTRSYMLDLPVAWGLISMVKAMYQSSDSSKGFQHNQSPISLAAIIFITSLVPANMDMIRTSRTARARGQASTRPKLSKNSRHWEAILFTRSVVRYFAINDWNCFARANNSGLQMRIAIIILGIVLPDSMRNQLLH